MFAYPVMDEEQAMNERFQILKAGEYDAVVQTSEDKVSANSGNPMMDITLSIYDAEGNTHPVRDFLVFTKSMMWKVIHCANSSGLANIYQQQKFCSLALLGRRVRVKLGIEEGKEIPHDKLNGKPSGSKYNAKNKVEDYIQVGNHATVANALQESDDDVPFN